MPHINGENKTAANHGKGSHYRILMKRKAEENNKAKAVFEMLLHNVDAHNVNVTGSVCYLT